MYAYVCLTTSRILCFVTLCKESEGVRVKASLLVKQWFEILDEPLTVS